MNYKLAFLLTATIIMLPRDITAQEPEISFLNLSPWELHVLDDLFIELSLLKCPSINRPAARSLKRFIASKITDVTTASELMNAQFYPVYQNLVSCLEHLDTGAHPTRANVVSPAADTDENGGSSEFQWETEMEAPNFKDVSSTSPVMEKALETKLASNKTVVAAFWDWLNRIFSDRSIMGTKTKREIQLEKLSTELEVQKKRTELAHKDFHTMVQMLSQIVYNVCPAKYKPNPLFTANAIEEIVSAVAADPATMVGGVDYFFVKAGLWHQVRKCLIESSKEPTNIITKANT